MRKRRVKVDESWRDQPPAPLPALEAPEWVKRWTRARYVGDFRIFPEQIPGMLALGMTPPREPMTAEDVWVQPHQHELALTTSGTPFA